jgi:hypothetical protein
MRKVIICIAVMSGIGMLPVITRHVEADTTADCGRFFLKVDPKSGRKTCANKQKPRTGSTRRIRRAQIGVQNALRQVDTIVRQDELTQEQTRRVELLLSSIRQRLDEIRNLTSQLQQEQKTRDQALANDQKQRVLAQKELSRRLRQQQQDLTRQLISRQRQYRRSLQRNN